MPESRHPALISKNPRFRALYLVKQNEFHFSLNKYKKYFFIFGCAFCPKNLAFARKNNGFAAPWLVRLSWPMRNMSMKYCKVAVHSVHAMNAEQRQTAADPWTKHQAHGREPFARL